MTDQPEHKTCQSCRQEFYRQPSPKDSAFRWMRRKFCSRACAQGVMKRGTWARPHAALAETEGER